MINKSIVLLLVAIASILLLESYIPLQIKEILYSTSLSIKSIIIFLLPFIIFGLIFNTVVNLSQNATKIIAGIIILVCCSNFLSTFLSHFVGEWIYTFDISLLSPKPENQLQPFWQYKFPYLISNDFALFSAVGFGLGFSKFLPQYAYRLSKFLNTCTQKILSLIMMLIPFFILGFIVKMKHEGMILNILHDYSLILGIIIISQIGYVLFNYLILNSFSFKRFFHDLKNMLPATLSGFSTMSSAASMPLAIMGVKSNTKNKELASSTLPMTVNIHLVGDCFAIPILAYAILKGFNFPEPTLYQYFIFSFYFVLAKFSVAAIPGGGILVMLPVLEKYFGFNAEMLSLITALYLLFDPIITATNVLGNGAFAKFIDNLVSFFNHKKAIKMSKQNQSQTEPVAIDHA